MHSHRRPREAAVRPPNVTERLPSPPPVPGLLSGDNWVVERTDENNVRTVLPLIGWQVVDGEVYPLPRSLGPEWTVRPVTEGDDRLIRNTAARLRTPPTNTQNHWNPWRHLYS